MTEQMTFGTLTIAFDERVLRPREWTSAQSDWAADLSLEAPSGPVLELCSGAGHIGLLSVALSGRSLVCVDASAVACDFARANAVAAGLADRVEVREGRLEDALAPGELVPVVIADPPWVPRQETGRYPEDPLTAIDGGNDGLDVARACLAVIDAHLAPGGSAVLQVGTTGQTDILRDEPCFAEGRLEMVEVRQEVRGVLARIDRAG
ncbi:class I SAM-dependent methyltransferase [Nocardioides sp. S-58]|uniref:Class I SAM-dependent methyltransferase n=1 Tax=Nocardioides renjunii TaxID=3095075 RepID=A0ABU5KEP0_9ACTN|nr:class I SAM-dependent methyltransferase [Nocardioides sp. S-58]MDZ5663341.1 class I SAM-dependent methyltransferase [Nocardioides sp. S-58]